MKCSSCLYEDNCSLREIAGDLTGCEGHSKEKSVSPVPVEDYRERYLEMKRKYENLKRDVDDGSFDGISDVLEQYSDMIINLNREIQQLKKASPVAILMSEARTEEERTALRKMFLMVDSFMKQKRLRDAYEGTSLKVKPLFFEKDDDDEQ